jgi:hypothetical protein
MATNTRNVVRTDPRFTSSQISIRVPWHYKAQLQRLADNKGVTLPMFVVETLMRTWRPEAPTQEIDEAAE